MDRANLKLFEGRVQFYIALSQQVAAGKYPLEVPARGVETDSVSLLTFVLLTTGSARRVGTIIVNPLTPHSWFPCYGDFLSLRSIRYKYPLATSPIVARDRASNPPFVVRSGHVQAAIYTHGIIKGRPLRKPFTISP
jgi:hypothetical protein